MPEPREPSLQVRFISLAWGVLFACSGLFKVLLLPEQGQLLTRLGLPAWLLVVVGAGEVIIGALILSPRWRPWGALAAALEMVVAAVTHFITQSEVPMVLANAALFVGAVWLLYQERSLLLPRREPHPTGHPTRRATRIG